MTPVLGGEKGVEEKRRGEEREGREEGSRGEKDEVSTAVEDRVIGAEAQDVHER